MAKISARIREKFIQRFGNTPNSWSGLVVVTFIVAQLYVLMEWIFLVTKPSFLDVFLMPEKLKILLMSGALAAGVSLLGLGVIYFFRLLVGLCRNPKGFFYIACFFPAGILAALLLLMLDNFTYTVFSFGIATTVGFGRALYLLLFLALIVWSFWQVTGAAISVQGWLVPVSRRRTVWIGIGAWLAVGLVLVVASDRTGYARLALGVEGDVPSNRPHIIWITGDGIDATQLSLYGYKRDNTPNLRALAESSLVAENAFSNVMNTMGSLTSMFTGKSALETRVMYSPDILLGEDSYLHLPAILRSYGYFAIQYGYQFYVDAYVVNMMEGFDISNGRSLASDLLQERLRRVMPDGAAYFVFETGNRIIDRLRHISFVKAMENPRETLATRVPTFSDEQRIASFLNDLDNYDQPMFIHLHYLGTHGAFFELKQKVFSAGRESTQMGWDPDFYDDAILEFDMSIGRMVEALEQHGLFENTLLIISSDHGAGFKQQRRLPLLIHFPRGEITGKINANVQNLDIAPTILDYLGLARPDWMSGDSLLGNFPQKRYIFGSGARTALGGPTPTGEWLINPERVFPPFYQLGAVTLIDCQRWYELDLLDMRLTSEDIEGHTSPCPADELLAIQQAFDMLLAFMRENNYDVSSLEEMPLESLLGGN